MGLEPGTRVGDWIVEQVVAADLYRCHRADMPFRKVVLRSVRSLDPAKLEAEADALSRLEHPNVQGVLGLESSGGELYLVAEATQGTSLATFLHTPPLPLKAALQIAAQVADALSTAHGRGIVHRDVRPEHIQLTSDGRAILSGFSLRNSLERLPAAGAYTPPEGLRGGQEARADAYAFGVLLYELITGNQIEVVPPAQRTALSLEVAVPKPLRELVAQLTHPDPEVRTSVSAAQQILGLALRDSLGDHSTSST